MRSLLILAIALAGCSQSSTDRSATTQRNVQMSRVALEDAVHPEPPGGCAPRQPEGSCRSNETLELPGVCVAGLSECKDGEFWGKDPKCTAPMTCTAVREHSEHEGDVAVEIFSVSYKGGGRKDVNVDNPHCDTLGLDASRCVWKCVDAKPGRSIDVDSVTFTAKEADGDFGYAYDNPLARGWRACGDGVDCDIGWSRWEERKVTPKYACGRFKNWSHDRTRFAKIQVKFLK